MSHELTILVADDNADLLETFAMIFERCGFNVETAASGRSAVDKYKERRFDVALMDIVMPGMNGVEASRRIKEMDPEAVIILMTGYSDEALLKAARDEGTCYIVQKPVNIERLIELVIEVASDQQILVINEDSDIPETRETPSINRKLRHVS
jgi:DNA-binding NtrC family response regulator